MVVDAGEVEIVGVLFGQFLGLEGRDDAVGVVGVVELDFGLNEPGAHQAAIVTLASEICGRGGDYGIVGLVDKVFISRLGHQQAV